METPKPPNGYDSWLDFATITIDYRIAVVTQPEFCDMGDAIFNAARDELAALRAKAATMDALRERLKDLSGTPELYTGYPGHSLGVVNGQTRLAGYLLAEFFPEDSDDE